MHVNFHTYRTIKRSLAQVLHTRANTHQEQHLNTLALMICGIIALIFAASVVNGLVRATLRFTGWLRDASV